MQLFDDYDFKLKNVFSFSFRQKYDEKILPWEIASFVNDYNTIYYKNDILNSISSAIENGFSPEDVFIIDGSLPLNKKYSQLDLLDENEAAKFFYKVGRPYSLHPSRKTYEINFIYEIFSAINSLLFLRKFKPLTTFFLIGALKKNRGEGISDAINYISEMAIKSSNNHYEKYPQSSADRDPLDIESINEKISGLIERQKNILSQLSGINIGDDAELYKIISSSAKKYQQKKKIFTKFFDIFGKINRPVVCLRVGDGKIRVLARALVNKNTDGSLLLRSATKNSPFQAIFEGMATAYKTFVDVSRGGELHEIEKSILDEKLREASFNANSAELRYRRELLLFEEINKSDVDAVNRIPASPYKSSLATAYINNNRAAVDMYREHGMEYVAGSFQIVKEIV